MPINTPSPCTSEYKCSYKPHLCNTILTKSVPKITDVATRSLRLSKRKYEK